MALYTDSAVLLHSTFCKQPKHCLKQQCFRQCFGHLQNVESGNNAETVYIQCHLKAKTLQSKAELTQKDFVVLYSAHDKFNRVAESFHLELYLEIL